MMIEVRPEESAPFQIEVADHADWQERLHDLLDKLNMLQLVQDEAWEAYSVATGEWEFSSEI